MSSTYVDVVADRVGPDAATFASLPPPLTRLVFLALPPDARGRASCVCRAWRDALAEPTLWTCLDMSLVHVEEQRSDTAFVGAARRARGQLQQLDLSGHEVTRDVLLPVLTANADSLRELHLDEVYAVNNFGTMMPTIQAVLAAAPLLQVLTTMFVHSTWEEASRLLRAEPPYALLQLRCSLVVNFSGQAAVQDAMARFGPFAAALMDAALQPALSRLGVGFTDTAQPAVMGALVDAALARRLHLLAMVECTPPAAAPLARLLTEGSLAHLEILQRSVGVVAPLFDAAGAALVSNALRVNATLTKLDLSYADLCEDTRVVELLLGALVGHPSLRELRISGENTTDETGRVFGGALAALIAADAPALHVLECDDNRLRDDGLTPIAEALPLNRHLRELDVGENGMSEAFARERLLPAVRVNGALRKLRCAYDDSGPAAAEAMELVRRRGNHG